jgi:hypothetical protein
MHTRRFTRLTNAFSKKVENHAHSVALFAMYYNFVCIPNPRSCSSYAVSSRHHLIDPIRPTREHIAISPQSGLYAMPSLCGSAEATRGFSLVSAGYILAFTIRPMFSQVGALVSRGLSHLGW